MENYIYTRKINSLIFRLFWSFNEKLFFKIEFIKKKRFRERLINAGMLHLFQSLFGELETVVMIWWFSFLLPWRCLSDSLGINWMIFLFLVLSFL